MTAYQKLEKKATKIRLILAEFSRNFGGVNKSLKSSGLVALDKWAGAKHLRVRPPTALA